MRRATHIKRLFAPAAAALLAIACLSPPGRAGEAAPKPGGEAGEAAGAGEFTDDLIVLKSDLAIEGRVIGRDSHSISVLVPYGVLSIPRAAVKYIEYNLASRLKDVAQDDYAGRYRILARAIEEGNVSQARPELEKLVGKPGVPPEIYRLLARCYETEGDLKKALEYWKKYALAKPHDDEAKKRVAELMEKLGIKPKQAAPSKGPAPGKKPVAGKVPQEKPEEKAEEEKPAGPPVTEGLEVGGKWSALPWGNPANVTVQAIEGNRVVMIEIPAGGRHDKAAIQRQDRPLDLSEYGKLAFRVFNGEKRRTDIAVALITSEDYFESRVVRANPDWNMNLSVDLRGNQWKSKATNWTFKTPVKGLDSVRQMIFLIYCGRRKALLYFDYVQLE